MGLVEPTGIRTLEVGGPWNTEPMPSGVVGRGPAPSGVAGRDPASSGAAGWDLTGAPRPAGAGNTDPIPSGVVGRESRFNTSWKNYQDITGRHLTRLQPLDKRSQGLHLRGRKPVGNTKGSKLSSPTPFRGPHPGSRILEMMRAVTIHTPVASSQGHPPPDPS